MIPDALSAKATNLHFSHATQGGAIIKADGDMKLSPNQSNETYLLETPLCERTLTAKSRKEFLGITSDNMESYLNFQNASRLLYQHQA